MHYVILSNGCCRSFPSSSTIVGSAIGISPTFILLLAPEASIAAVKVLLFSLPSLLGTTVTNGTRMHTAMPCMRAVRQKVVPKPMLSTRMPPSRAEPDQPKIRTPSKLFHLALDSCMHKCVRLPCFITVYQTIQLNKNHRQCPCNGPTRLFVHAFDSCV